MLLLSTGLTTVDIVLRLRKLGHRGTLLALSRRGLTPRVQAAFERRRHLNRDNGHLPEVPLVNRPRAPPR